MLKVEVDKNTGLEKALKTLKGKVIKTKQNEQLRKRTEYVKNSTLKREKMKKAKYKQYLQSKSQSN
jgi:small subunit ribosomal protein S21